MTTFAVSAAFEVPTELYHGYLRLGSLRNFWQDEDGPGAYRGKRGVYVFGIRHGGISPTYVGLATKSFGQEALSPRNRRDHYVPALRERKRGQAVLIFVWHKYTKKPNFLSINDLETQLIQHAVRKDIPLTNLRKKFIKDLKIEGVYDFKNARRPQGRANGDAKAFREMLGF